MRATNERQQEMRCSVCLAPSCGVHAWCAGTPLCSAAMTVLAIAWSWKHISMSLWY
jgi:hypothetical protein